MADFMQQYITPDKHIIFDGTQIISNSEKLVINQVGYNSHEDFAPQINLLYAFAVNSNTPTYYRVFNGDVCEVSAFKLSLEEMGGENLVVSYCG
jgi:transposase